MADSKITALTSISTSTDPANDPLVIVDVSDTSMAATGTTKKVTLNQLLGASGTATLASATITGDLTVDTSTLKVDSANNRVGIGTASPANQLSVRNEGASGIAVIDVRGGSAGAGAVQISGNATTLGTTSFDLIQNSSGAFVNQRDANPLSMFVNGSERYAISSSGVATWSNVGGVAGTAMTLNSTGLGVGVASPAAKVHVVGGAAQNPLILDSTGYNHCVLKVSGTNRGQFYADATNCFAVVNSAGSATPFVVTDTGNVGIGVTPINRLTVAGNMAIGGTGNNGLQFHSGSPVSGNLVWWLTNDQANSNILNLYYYSAGVFSGRAFVVNQSGNFMVRTPATPPTIPDNEMMVFNLTSNTNLRVSVKGTDGVTRVANITLA